MNKLGFLFFLLILAIIESAVSVHLILIGALILLQFVPIRPLLLWTFLAGLTLDLLLGNFLGINSAILIPAIFILNLVKQFLWPNLTYTQFPRQTTATTIFQVILTAKFYDYFYNLASFGVWVVNLDLRLTAAEIILTASLFPVISYLALHWTPQEQLELKF